MQANAYSPNTDADLCDEIGPLFEDISQYRKLVGILIYFTVRRSDIAYIVRLVSQFIYKPRDSLEAYLRILTYIKGSLSKWLLYKNHGLVRIEPFNKG